VRRALFGICLSALACGPPSGSPPDAVESAVPQAAPAGAGWFTDVAGESGLHFVHDAGRTPEKHLPETMGGGAVLADLDGDDDLDVYLVQSGPLPGQPAPDGRPTNRLFLNDGGGRFRDATAECGDAAHDGYGQGVAAGDVDGDGDLDLYVTNLGPDVLLLNDGRGRFEEATARAGLGDDRWTTAAALFDADNDGDPDLYVTGYVQVDLEHPLWCGDRRPGHRSYCHPDVYPGLPPRFWRNLGDGTFVEATEPAGLAVDPRHPGKGLGAIASDLDLDGDLDLYVANDSVENRLWINQGDGTFTDGTLLSGTGVDSQGRTEAGMGLATGDVDGDLDVDLFVTNFDDESNTLYRNDGDGFFTDVTVASGLEGPSRLPVGFGTVLEDLDDDGDLDLAVANGHIIDNIELYHDGKTWKQFAQLFRNDGGGRFEELTSRSGDLGREPLVGRGLAAGDIDDDGDLDLLLTQCGGPALLLRNNGGPDGGPAGGSVTLRGLPPGTRVEARLEAGGSLLRESGQQSSYLSPWPSEVHLGLGSGALVQLVLTVPGRPPVSIPVSPPARSAVLGFTEEDQRLTLRSRTDRR
jgi:hypothetical protein